MGAKLDRDRERRLPVPPPSKPDRRISRIRLSSRWFTSERIDRSEPERRGESARAQAGQHKLPGTPKGGRQHGKRAGRRETASPPGQLGSGALSPKALPPVSSPPFLHLVIHLPALPSLHGHYATSSLLWAL
jgi:hypothetical protein